APLPVEAEPEPEPAPALQASGQEPVVPGQAINTSPEDQARNTADVWTLIEAKDPGCWVPESVIAYWREQGRNYRVLKPRQEPPQPERQIAPPAPAKKKAVDLATRQVVEVV